MVLALVAKGIAEEGRANFTLLPKKASSITGASTIDSIA